MSNPREVAPIAPAAPGSLTEMLSTMRAAQSRDPMPDWPTRADRLRRLKSLLLDNRDAIVGAIAADFGRRPAEETDVLEIFPSVSGIKHALRHGRRWMRGRSRWANFWFLPARTRLVPRPLGVVGIMVPWNYPLYLATGPLTDALAAGNRAMIKMPEGTPRFSALFAELVAKNFGGDEVTIVSGDPDVARAFAALPFDHILFTGSTAVGRDVMRAAAANLTPVTLELGGKSPAIIGPQARFDHAVERILIGKLINAGQTCIAPDYVLLPRKRIDEFVALARAGVERLYPGIAANAQYASVVSERHFERLESLRDDAQKRGATVHSLGDAAAARSQRVLVPTLLTGVDDSMQVMHEEIFGPLLPLVAYDSLDEALNYIEARPHPLALYVFDENRATIDRVLERTHAGGITVNDTIFHIAQHELPFGGVGASGMGVYHGKAGFRTFSRMQPVMSQARWNAVGLLSPPYGRTFARLVKILLGR